MLGLGGVVVIELGEVIGVGACTCHVVAGGAGLEQAFRCSYLIEGEDLSAFAHLDESASAAHAEVAVSYLCYWSGRENSNFRRPGPGPDFAAC